MNRLIYRAMDANFNRVREGLRVCEEFVRFAADDKKLTQDFKKMRNRINKIYGSLASMPKGFFLARDSAKDVGRKGFGFERKRARISDIFWTNIGRSKEALRVLEEFSKLISVEFSDSFRKERYKLYDLEKKSVKQIKSLFNAK